MALRYSQCLALIVAVLSVAGMIARAQAQGVGGVATRDKNAHGVGGAAMRQQNAHGVGGAAMRQQNAQPPLFVSARVTPNEYTSGIEGPAVDKLGNLYVVNLGKAGTIGKLSPGGNTSELFATLPEGSIGNGIRFNRDGAMFVADYKGHNIHVIAPGKTEASIYFQSSDFTQPNDLAIAADGTLYASDPNFKDGTGRIWRITRGADGLGRGDVMSSDRRMGVTNGIDLSNDGKVLYVSESSTREVWAYKLQEQRLVAPRLVKRFDTPKGTELDGLRTDNSGRIFVTRPGNGTVAVLRANGSLEREIKLHGKTPTNLAFGGPDGKTVFVTQADGGYVESFRSNQPGREFCLLNDTGRC